MVFSEEDKPIENPEVADRALRACIRARGGHFEQLLNVFALHCLFTVIFFNFATVCFV